MSKLLPITTEEMQFRGWDAVDFVCVTGDSYVDHPSFGAAVISRLIESLGFRVAVLPQPQNESDYTHFGRPKLGFMVTGGNIDSMVAHYTAAKRKRSDDPYTSGNKAGKRPETLEEFAIVNQKKIDDGGNYCLEELKNIEDK